MECKISEHRIEEEKSYSLSPVECRDQACSQAQLRDQNDGFICELYQVDYVQALLLFTIIYYEVDGT